MKSLPPTSPPSQVDVEKAYLVGRAVAAGLLWPEEAAAVLAEAPEDLWLAFELGVLEDRG